MKTNKIFIAVFFAVVFLATCCILLPVETIIRLAYYRPHIKKIEACGADIEWIGKETVGYEYSGRGWFVYFDSKSVLRPEAINTLERLNNVAVISVWTGGKVSKDDVSRLCNLQGVREVGIYIAEIEPFSQIHLNAKNCVLERLRLRGGGLRDEDLEEILKCGQLSVLDIRGYFSNRVIKQLGRLENLELLALSGGELSSGTTLEKPLFKMKNLYLNDYRLGPESLNILHSMPNLTHLTLSGKELTCDTSFEKPVKNIERLYLYDYAHIGHEGLGMINSMPNLKCVHFWKARLSKENQAFLAHLRDRCDVTVRGCDLEGDAEGTEKNRGKVMRFPIDADGIDK